MFEKVYDILMEDVDYRLLLTQFENDINKDHFILDAGCGTGYFLKVLLEENYQAIGLDHNVGMLSLAKEKLSSSGLPQPLFEHDLRHPMGMKFDIIFSLFDVVNYFKGTKKLFNNFYQALNEKGTLIFDVYQKQVINTYDGYSENESEPIAYTWSMKIKGKRLYHEVITEGNTYKTIQYIYPLSYYLDMLKEAGFKDIDVRQGIDQRKFYIIAYK
jgi:SAM-dependent methyltransferase